MATATTTKRRKKKTSTETSPPTTPTAETSKNVVETAPPPVPEVKVSAPEAPKAEGKKKGATSQQTQTSGKKRSANTGEKAVARLAGRRRAIAQTVVELGPGIWRASEYVNEVNSKLKSLGYKPTNAVGVLHTFDALKERGLEYDRIRGTVYVVDTSKVKL